MHSWRSCWSRIRARAAGQLHSRAFTDSQRSPFGMSSGPFWAGARDASSSVLRSSAKELGSQACSEFSEFVRPQPQPSNRLNRLIGLSAHSPAWTHRFCGTLGSWDVRVREGGQAGPRDVNSRQRLVVKAASACRERERASSLRDEPCNESELCSLKFPSSVTCETS